MNSLVKVYASRARPGLGTADVAEILAVSRRRNSLVGISGMLLCASDRFLQLIEGPRDAVEATYRRIAADPRHSEMVLSYEGVDEPRRFTSWAMGFARIEDFPQVPGVSAFMQIDDRFDVVGFAADKALGLLMDFRRAHAEAWAAAPHAA